jgi:hypothetical protein
VSDLRLLAKSLNRNGVDFVMVDLDAALTFMDVADASRVSEIRQRNHQNARKAYETAGRLLQKLSPSAEQQREIGLKLARLKGRLVAAGQGF